MGDGGDANGRLGRTVAGDIAGDFGKGAFHHEGRRIEAEIAFDHDLGAGRHVQVDRFAFDQFDRRAADGADHVVFAKPFRHRRAGDKAERWLPADRNRNRHFLVPGLLPRGHVMADMLRAPHQDRNAILAADHAAIDADIHDAADRILGDDAAIGHDVTAAVRSIPLRHRKFVQIDVVAFDDVFLRRTGLDDFRRQALRQNTAAELDQFARMGVGRQTQHHGDAARAGQSAGENLTAPRIGAVVADIAE